MITVNNLHVCVYFVFILNLDVVLGKRSCVGDVSISLALLLNKFLERVMLKRKQSMVQK